VYLPDELSKVKCQGQEKESGYTDDRKKPDRRICLCSKQLKGKVKDQFQHWAQEKTKGKREE
jgi:hypothetical protein